ncbi:MAG: hypothetical protein IME96_11675 [Proteobacteria bacterium]|nr:hypothetical protein [Pseudomonadota bacterium]
MEETVKVAIVGLGRVGSKFIQKISEFEGKGVTIVAAAEKNATSPGIAIAEGKGIKVYEDEKYITSMGDKVDVVFDLSGDKTVGRDMRLAYGRALNTHTVIVPRIMAVMIWNMFSDGEALPEHTN